MNIKARFFCESVSNTGQLQPSDGTMKNGNIVSQRVVLQAVYSIGIDDPNKTFSAFTPSARVEIMITNPEAWQAFKPGHLYDAMFSPVSEEKPHEPGRAQPEGR